MSIFSQINQQASQISTSANAAESLARTAGATFRTHSDAVLPTPEFFLTREPVGIQLYGFQAAAVETIQTYRRVLLGYAPGMGKTVVALTAIANDLDRDPSHRAIVVVPPSLRLMWVREINRFFPHLTVELVQGGKPAVIPTADVTVVGDSIVAKRLDDLKALGAQALYVDEAHRMKSLAAQRTKATSELAESLLGDATIVGLTGTLAVNKPDEIFGPLRMTGAANARYISGGSTYTAFKQRWCITEQIRVAGGRIVNNVVGCVDPQALHEALRSQVYVRVERDDVLDMPGKVWEVQNLSLNGDMAEYRRAEKDFINWMAEVSGDKAAHRAAKAEAIVKLMKLWEVAGKAKVSSATPDYIADLVAQGEQVVVMGHHAAVISNLEDALAKRNITTVKIVGGMGDAAKQEAERAFKAGEVDVLIGNIQAAGVGLNLESAANLIFTQLPWSPGDLQQAADRIYRLTQQRNCTIHVLNALDSVDERMWAVLQAKAHVVDSINAGHAVTLPQDSVFEAVLDSYGW